MKTATCNESLDNCLEIVAEPTNKASTLVPLSVVTKASNDYRSGFSSLCILKENLFTSSFTSFFYPIYSPFIERFNDKIRELHSSGLTDYWEKKYLNSKGLIRKSEDIGPQVLTMEHLEVCFIICILPLLLGLIAFAGEIVFARWKRQFARTIVVNLALEKASFEPKRNHS